MKTLVFLGSVRDSGPLHPRRLDARVAHACVRKLATAGLDAEIIDPYDYDLPQVFKPHFAYAPSRAPGGLVDLAHRIQSADSYVAVSAEYNH